MDTAYVYKWTHLPTLMWYIGSRTSKKAHPNDGYITSSKIVKAKIKVHPTEWKREIIEIGDPVSMYNLEQELLGLSEAWTDRRSFNYSLPFGPITKETLARRTKVGEQNSINLKGKKRSRESIEKARNTMLSLGIKRPCSIETRKQISLTKTGVTNSTEKQKEAARQVGVSNKGKKRSEEVRALWSAQRKGKNAIPCSDHRRQAIIDGWKRRKEELGLD